jgi:hypothetical protein
MTAPRWEAMCRTCGRTFPVSDDETDDLAASGWPVCCGRDMSILYRPDGVQVDHRPALPQTQRASS